MSYRANEVQQLSIFDRSLRLTERERKCLEKSWAKVFSDEIFPAIDEDRFRVLYSQTASRPNTPVNVIVGALIIKELFDLSDDEVVENLMLDIHYQYALHTTSFEEQPLSDKTLSRFRKRCYDYELATGIDLFHACIRDLNTKIAKMMGINSRIRRMDSLMIEANIRKLSRIGLLYSCVARLVQHIYKTGIEIDLTGLEHYNDPEDRNYVIYHSRNIDVDNRTLLIMQDADLLLSRCGEKAHDISEYQLLMRCLNEQTVVENGRRRLRAKKQESPSPASLQNPTDPEATFNSKSGKNHIGYIANIVEAVDRSGSVITDYQFEQNIYSDGRFLADYMESIGYQEETVTIVADGGYSGQPVRDAAERNNLQVINTALKGCAVSDAYADFEMNKDGTQLLKCPAGHAPLRCRYFDSSKQVKSYFAHDTCHNCPQKERCIVKLRPGKTNMVAISRSAVERALQQRKMEYREFHHWQRIRNGIEAIPSILRNYYHVDKMPVRGKIRSKFFFGAKISAINFKKLLLHKRGFNKHPFNPLLA